MTLARAVQAVIAGVLLLSGCTVVSEGDRSGSAAEVPIEIPSGVVARGDIRLADGSTFGTAMITWDDGALGVQIPDIEPLFGDEQSLVALADGEVDFTMCGTENVWQVGFGDAPTLAGLPMPYAQGDPSFYRYLLVMPYWREGECAEPIVGLARLEWDVPETRPWLEVVDSGRTSGAQGGVIVDDGEPRFYLTAAGDVWTEIARRFGISPNDLEYLNPIRAGNDVPGMAFEAQVLNLDPDERGFSERRRPGSELSRSAAFT